MPLAAQTPLPVVIGIFGILLGLAGWVFARVGPPWIRARRSGVPLPFTEAFGMWIRRGRLDRIVAAAIRLRQVGCPERVATIEIHDLAGGDVERVAEARATALEHGITARWEHLVACDLAGRDVVEIVRAGVDPARVIGAKEFEGRFRKAVGA